MIAFGAILQVEMITVDSSDQQASPDFQPLHGIGYPSSSRCAQAWFFSALDTSVCSSSCLYCSMSNAISPFGICEIWRPVNRQLPVVPGSKIKLFAHCCHDSVESLISTADHIVDMHTEHSMDLPILSKNKCTWVESTPCETMLDERFLESVPPLLL